MRRTLYQSPHFRIEVRPDDIVVLTRSAEPFGSAEEIDSTCMPVQLTLNHVGRRGKRLLVDTRAAVGNNNPAFEVAFAAHRQRMVQGFAKVAIVVQTAIGKLQNQRLVGEPSLAQDRSAPGEMRVFMNIEDALAYLGAEPPKPAEPPSRSGTSSADLPKSSGPRPVRSSLGSPQSEPGPRADDAEPLFRSRRK